MSAGEALVLVNGQPGATVSVHDRGLHYGDGLFETMACRDGRIRWLDRHLARLALGCERLGLAMPGPVLLRGELQALAAGQAAAIIKLILTRGEARKRGYRPTDGEPTTRVLSRHPWPAAPGTPLRAHLSPVRLGSNALLAGLKHLNRLEQVLAQQAAARAGVDEALQCDGEGFVVAASQGNLYVADGAGWITPPIIDCGVAGIVRSVLLELAPRAGVQVRVQRLHAAQLAAAEHVTLSNVRLGLQAVDWYEGRALRADPRLARLQELLDAS